MRYTATSHRPSARRRHTMLLALAAAAAVMAPLAVSATARAAPTGPRGSAFVWANHPSTASYTPSATYQWNSHHPGAAVNTITRTGKGSYTVRLPGLDAKSGTAIATAYGPNPTTARWRTCVLVIVLFLAVPPSWSTSGASP